MSRIITDSAGVQIEVFTPEEIEADKQAAIEKYKEDNPDKSDEIDSLQAELKNKEEELTKLKNKDFNFANLRSQKETAEGKIEEIKKEIDTKIESAKKEVLESVMKDHYNETLKILASEDEEFKKKIEFNYKRIQDIPTTKEELTKKLTDALALATKPENLDALNVSVISSGGVSKLNLKSQEKKFTPEEKEFGKKLGSAGGIKLEDKDFEQ